VFGEEKLCDFLLKNASESAVRLIEKIVSAVHAHAGESPQADDMTILIIRRVA
jgi:serine phosphatase RsbU (regulator of sigma subunit)